MQACGPGGSQGDRRVTGLPPGVAGPPARLLTGRLGHPGANIPEAKGRAASPSVTTSQVRPLHSHSAERWVVNKVTSHSDSRRGRRRRLILRGSP